MVTWHRTMKLFPAKRHERATLRKLWRQTGNSSLLPAKCWPLLHMIRACSWRWPDVVARISPRFSKFAFVLFCFITNHLMTGPLGNSEFCLPRISMFPSTSSRETLTLRFSGNKIHCSPRDQSLSVYCLTLSVDLSPLVPPETKRGRIEKNESKQPAGTVHEMQH